MTRTRSWERKGASDKSTSKVSAKQDSKTAGMNYAAFKEKAKPITIRIGEDLEVKASPKEFRTGSFGWSANGNKTLSLDGEGDEKVDVVISFNITVKGSKPASSSKNKVQSAASNMGQGGRGKKRKASESGKDLNDEEPKAEAEDEELTEVSGEEGN